MKRILLFVTTNLAVLLVLTTIVKILGVDGFLTAQGMDLRTLIVFSAIVGFSGSIVSLLISKPMAKWSTGARVITAPANSTERWLVETVAQLSRRAKVRMPEVAIYPGGPNAFATGAFRNSALVAVSTGLLETMSRDAVEAVPGHEMAHVANGDMVTLTLSKRFEHFRCGPLARCRICRRSDVFRTEERESGPGFYVTVVLSEILFGILATLIVIWFSRQREYRADRGSADYLGSPRAMIQALRRLAGVEAGHLPESLRAMGISDRPRWLALFSNHPPIETRIAALQPALN